MAGNGINHIAHNGRPWPPANSSLAAEQAIRSNYSNEMYSYHVCEAATGFDHLDARLF
jgi:hypothetical protein